MLNKLLTILNNSNYSTITLTIQPEYCSVFPSLILNKTFSFIHVDKSSKTVTLRDSLLDKDYVIIANINNVNEVENKLVQLCCSDGIDTKKIVNKYNLKLN